MKIYTTFKSIPELADLSREERKMIWGKYYVKCFYSWKTWIVFFVFILFQLAIGELRFFLKDSFPEIHRRYIDYPLITIGWLVGYLIVFQILVAVVRPYLANERTTQKRN